MDRRAWFFLLVLAACGSETAILCESQGCSDGNPCTQDRCVPTEGCQHTAVGGIPCADDANACTDDVCVAPGGCTHPAKAAATCSDGDLCTTADSCSAGACVGGGPLDCDDKNVCTADTCDQHKGCTHVAQAGACDDGSVCTNAEQCDGGACHGGTPKDCADSDPCTADSCDAKTGCAHAAASGALCTDGSLCTHDDTCTAGSCQGVPVTCSDGNPCTADSCDPKLGCVFVAKPGPCDDADACTSGDACQGLSCIGKPTECGDGNPCTADTCSATAGCSHVALPGGATCDDNDACTQDDSCDGQLCQGAPVICSDANPCTSDACNKQKGCTATAKSGDCSDGNACTAGDACAGGLCVGSAPVSCEDGDPCTTEDCVADFGCIHQVLTGLPCDDKNACTSGEKCQALPTACAGGATISCADSNPCTLDSCDTQTGCTHSFAQAPCDDGDPCTVLEYCQFGQCTGGKKMGCKDANPCTDDSCFLGLGCLYMPNSAPCDDGDACTVGDICDASKCAGTLQGICDDANLCTADACNAKTGDCSHTVLVGLLCDDANPCSATDQCDAKGLCKGAGNSCDDGNACTTDACDPAKSGACLHTAVDCNDKRPCTLDTCLAVGGCQHALTLGVACDDGNACTASDTCQGANSCVGKVTTCADGNPCTDDGCDKLKGCVFLPNTLPCDDGDVCFTGDLCGGGKCLPGNQKLNCSDGNGCTADTCDAKTGCSHGPAPEWTSCDAQDGNMVCSTTGACIHVGFLKGAFYVAGATAQFGCNQALFGNCPAAELPVHVATIDPIYMDYSEVRVSEYAKCVAAGKCPAIADPKCNANLGGKADHPANCLGRAAAASYCAFVGKRLPTEHEWEHAARGPTCAQAVAGVCQLGTQVYPWGAAEPTCSLAIFMGTTAGCGAGGTWSVGAGWHAPWGLVGLAGNVAEWVADDYAATAYQSAAAINPKGPAPTGVGILRGGSAWSWPAELAISRRQGKAPEPGDLTTGVRCAHDFVPP